MATTNTHWNADLYNDKHDFVYNYGQSLLDMLDLKGDELVLDLGCGSGQLTAQIKTLGAQVVGMDESKEMVEDAKEKYPDIDFRQADAANFHFEEQFDIIFSNATLHWVTKYQSAVQCIYNHLKPGGQMIVEFGGKGNIQTIIDQLRKTLKVHGFHQQAELQQWYFPSIGEYTPVLETAGFKVDFAHHYDRPTPLADLSSGIIDWLSMFAGNFFEGIEPEIALIIRQEVQEAIQDQCYIDGRWYADYKRLRIQAVKPE